MKKIVLTIAGVMAAAAFAPEASALPAFARQTGMACSACHFQKFPVLNGFGRAFKAAGYTMMGAQEKVEGEHLSIPATLNAAILAKVRYQKDNTAKKVVNTAANNLGDGQLQFGDEFSLFFGGRVAENIGFLFEGNTVNHTIAGVGGTGGLLAGFKLPVMFDMGSAKIGVVPFTTDALGAQYGFELSSGGVLRANRWSELRREASAVQYNADQGKDGGQATGIAFVAQNDFGFINVTKWAPAFGMGSNGGNVPSYDMKSTYVRIAATPTVGDWAMVIGAGSMTGTSGYNQLAPAVVPGLVIDTKQTYFDLQAHGELAGKEIGVYAQHASAPATVNGNSYNGTLLGAGGTTRKATTIGAEYSVIPHALAIGAAYRSAQNGKLAGATGDNSILLTAVYDLTQNVALHLDYASYSGSSRNAVGSQKNQYLLMLEGAF